MHAGSLGAIGKIYGGVKIGGPAQSRYSGTSDLVVWHFLQRAGVLRIPKNNHWKFVRNSCDRH